MTTTLHNIDFRCSLAKKCKQFMLDVRIVERGIDKDATNLKNLFSEIMKIKKEIKNLPYEILHKRKDLLFYLGNARQCTTDMELRYEIDICYKIIKVNIDISKKFAT